MNVLKQKQRKIILLFLAMITCASAVFPSVMGDVHTTQAKEDRPMAHVIPPAPTQIMTQVTGQTVTVSWTRIDQETKECKAWAPTGYVYEVWRSETSDPKDPKAVRIFDGVLFYPQVMAYHPCSLRISHTDEQVIAGKTYYYHVRGVTVDEPRGVLGAFGTSQPTKIERNETEQRPAVPQVDPITRTIPLAPTQIMTQVTDQTVTVSWTRIDQETKECKAWAPTGYVYEVWRSETSDPKDPKAVRIFDGVLFYSQVMAYRPCSLRISHKDAQVVAGKTYYYHVRGVTVDEPRGVLGAFGTSQPTKIERKAVEQRSVVGSQPVSSLVAPVVPRDVLAKSSGQTIVVTWTVNGSPSQPKGRCWAKEGVKTEYQVWRSLSANPFDRKTVAKHIFSGAVSQTGTGANGTSCQLKMQYVDRHAPRGMKVYYHVRGVVRTTDRNVIGSFITSRPVTLAVPRGAR